MPSFLHSGLCFLRFVYIVACIFFIVCIWMTTPWFLFSLLLMGTWIVSNLRSLRRSSEDICAILLWYISLIFSYVNIQEQKTVSQGRYVFSYIWCCEAVVSFYFPTSNEGEFHFLTSVSALCTIRLFNFSLCWFMWHIISW